MALTFSNPKSSEIQHHGRNIETIIPATSTGYLTNFYLSTPITLHFTATSSSVLINTHHHRCHSPGAVHSPPAPGIPPRWRNYSPLRKLPPLWAAEWYLPTRTLCQTEGGTTRVECAIHGPGWEEKMATWCPNTALRGNLDLHHG